MNSTEIQRKVIIDVDPGSDDAWALHLLINWERKLNLKILGITCTFGNSTIEYVSRNVLMILTALNRTDIPVYPGADEPFVKKHPITVAFHGIDGFGDLPDYGIDPDMSLLKDEHASNMLRRSINENPNEISIISVGPLSNLAYCLKLYPETRDKIKEILIMGGNYLGVGNITPGAEFNFYSDPEAADAILKLAKCPIKILPWEACTTKNIQIPLPWRFELKSGEKYKKFLTLLNKIESNMYLNKPNWIPCDALAIAAFLNPKIIEISNYYCTQIELAGDFTRGQMVVNYKAPDHLKNIFIIEKVNVELFKEMIVDSLKD